MTDTPTFDWSDLVIGTLSVLLVCTVLLAALAGRGPDSATARLQSALGAGPAPTPLVLLLALVWTALFLALLSGLFMLLIHGVTGLIAGAASEALRGDAILLAAFTATLGAVVALPLTLIRIGLTRDQTRTAELTLFNQRIRSASEDLYATKRITRQIEAPPDAPTWHDMQQDDIVRRNVAILTLETLANERPETVQDVARTLGAYVREMSREHPAEPVPEGLEGNTLVNWARGLKVKRTDMQTSVQALGRLRKAHPDAFSNSPIDLSEANLQAMRLEAKDLSFEGALLVEAQMQTAVLVGARLTGADFTSAQMQQADLSLAWMQGANLQFAQLQKADLSGARMQGADLIHTQMDRSNLRGALIDRAVLRMTRMEGADLSGARMQGALLVQARIEGADLTDTVFRGAAVSSVDFTNVQQITYHLNEIFGDLATRPPEGVNRPAHWTHANALSFEDAWRKWQAEIGFDPDDPATW